MILKASQRDPWQISNMSSQLLCYSMKALITDISRLHQQMIFRDIYVIPVGESKTCCLTRKYVTTKIEDIHSDQLMKIHSIILVPVHRQV